MLLQTLMSAVLLSRFVTSMPTVRILTDLMLVPVKQDLLEMEKLALVRKYTSNINKNMNIVMREKQANKQYKPP